MAANEPKGIETKGQIVDVHPKYKIHSDDSTPEQYIEVKIRIDGLNGETIKWLTRHLNLQVGMVIVPEQMELPGFGKDSK